MIEFYFYLSGPFEMKLELLLALKSLFVRRVTVKRNDMTAQYSPRGNSLAIDLIGEFLCG